MPGELCSAEKQTQTPGKSRRNSVLRLTFEKNSYKMGTVKQTGTSGQVPGRPFSFMIRILKSRERQRCQSVRIRAADEIMACLCRFQGRKGVFHMDAIDHKIILALKENGRRKARHQSGDSSLRLLRD